MAKNSIPWESDDQKPDNFGVNDRGDNRTPQIRHTRPEVARHAARLIIVNNMDYDAAVAKMLSVNYPNATEAQITAISRSLQKSPGVQLAIKDILENIGYGDEAINKLLGLLWKEALGPNDKRWPAAMRMLGEFLQVAKAADGSKKVPSLKLEGMEAGLANMLGDAAPSNETPEPDALPDPEFIIEDEATDEEDVE